MGLTKKQILLKIGEVDDKILKFADTNPEIHPELLTVNELKEVLQTFEKLYGFFEKAATVKEKKHNSHFRVGGKNRKYGH